MAHEVDKQDLDKKEQRKAYYITYYKRNRKRLLEYQTEYNLTHNLVKQTKTKKTIKGRLATTRDNLKKRLLQNEKRVQLFKARLNEQAKESSAGSNPVASLPLS